MRVVGPVDVRRGFCRSSGATTSVLHLRGCLGYELEGGQPWLEQIESQDDEDRRLRDEATESTEDWEEESDHSEAEVDCEIDMGAAYCAWGGLVWTTL